MLLQCRVVRVTLWSGRVEGVGIRSIQRGARLPTPDQVGVGEDRACDGDEVALACGKIALGALEVITS